MAALQLISFYGPVKLFLATLLPVGVFLPSGCGIENIKICICILNQQRRINKVNKIRIWVHL